MQHVDIVEFEGALVLKDHGGVDGVERARTSAIAMRAAVAAGLPVPEVVAQEGPLLRQQHVDGAEMGVVLLQRDPERLLAHIGAFAASLHALPPPDGLPVHDLEGRWVHGDLCPVNTLVDPATDGLLAVVDWEASRVDDPVLDLAWSEWLVRSFHDEVAWALPALYDAYGRTPDAVHRRRTMARLLARERRRAQYPEEQRLWARRLEELGELDIAL